MNQIYVVVGEKISYSSLPGVVNNTRIVKKTLIKAFTKFPKAAEFTASQLNGDEIGKSIYQVYTKFKNGFDNMYVEVIELE